jgi:hypothetical protein
MERLLNPKYWTYYENTWLQRPGLNADLAAATPNAAEIATSFSKHKDLEILGTNMTSALCTSAEGGGITLTTAGADGDSGILLAHLDTAQTALATCNWDSANRPLFMANIVTGANITNAIIWAGFKLTNTPVTATDADQAFFRYEDDVVSGDWQAVTSVGGTDDAHDTNIPGRVSSLVRLVIDVDINRQPRFYINDKLVETGAALTALNTFEFYIGVEADGAAAAKAITIRNFMVSQLYG